MDFPKTWYKHYLYKYFRLFVKDPIIAMRDKEAMSRPITWACVWVLHLTTSMMMLTPTASAVNKMKEAQASQQKLETGYTPLILQVMN